MNPAALRTHVIEQLTSVGGLQKGSEIQILCPFHNDRRPSLNVHVGFKITPGSYHCFACNARGDWNALAQALRLKKVHYETAPLVKQGKIYDDPEDPFQLLAQELEANPIFQEEKIRSLKGLEPIPEEFTWRGYDAEFYKSLGASYYWTEKIEYLYFPLTTYGEHKGYTLIAAHTAEERYVKYQIFAEAKKVFFLYDLLPPREPIVITEGHFDAIRLIAEGFCATAILGVNNWSEFKRQLLIAKCPPIIIIALDGDQAGYDASVKIFKDLRDGSEVDIYYLPPQEPKLDPGNMPQKYLNELREKVYGARNIL